MSAHMDRSVLTGDEGTLGEAIAEAWRHWPKLDRRPVQRVRVLASLAGSGREWACPRPSNKDSSIWYVHCFQDILKQKGVDYGNLNFCAFGMRDPVSRKYYKKGTSLLHHFPAGTLDPIFKLCPNTAAKKMHEHEVCEGHATGHGSRTKLSQIYPYKFCEQLAHISETISALY